MEVLYWVLALLVILLALYVVGTRPYDYFAKHNIPYVKPLPFVGNSGPMMTRSEHIAVYMNRTYKHFKDHPFVGYYDFLRPVIVIRDPELIKLVTVKDADYFIDHRSALPQGIEPLVDKNLMGLRGQEWKNMRSTLSPAFTSSKMKNMFTLISKCGEQMADYLGKHCEDSVDGIYSLEMKEFFTRYTTDVIATSAFGVHVDSLAQPDNEFFEMGRVASDFSASRVLVLLLYLMAPRFMKKIGISVFPKPVSNFFRTLIHDTLEVRERDGIVRPDMIHLMMQARKGTLKHDDITEGTEEKSGPKAEMTEDDIVANALVFFLAGFDTVSTLLSFVTNLLAVHPDIQRRLQQEIDDVLEADNGKLTYEGVQQMKYLEMVVSETLRLYPPAIATERVCVKPYVLKATDKSPEYKFKVGDGLNIPVFPLHRDPKYFPNPESFDPERFNDDNKHNIKPYTYLPFGAGPRICIGLRFALMEAKVALVCLLRRFDLEPVAKTPIPMKLDRKKFSMMVEGGFWLGFKPRNMQ